jgi:hypothetical protein
MRHPDASSTNVSVGRPQKRGEIPDSGPTGDGNYLHGLGSGEQRAMHLICDKETVDGRLDFDVCGSPLAVRPDGGDRDSPVRVRIAGRPGLPAEMV